MTTLGPKTPYRVGAPVYLVNSYLTKTRRLRSPRSHFAVKGKPRGEVISCRKVPNFPHYRVVVRTFQPFATQDLPPNGGPGCLEPVRIGVARTRYSLAIDPDYEFLMGGQDGNPDRTDDDG